jgi:ABC-type glycerol-3-phosphate transport system substrate-binding protein
MTKMHTPIALALAALLTLSACSGSVKEEAHDHAEGAEAAHDHGEEGEHGEEAAAKGPNGGRLRSFAFI